MRKFLKEKLKREYGADSELPYMVMNKIGAMQSNKETANGREMERKHRLDARSAAGIRKKAGLST